MRQDTTYHVKGTPIFNTSFVWTSGSALQKSLATGAVCKGLFAWLQLLDIRLSGFGVRWNQRGN